MNKECERKFLVSSDVWKQDISSRVDIEQFYISITKNSSTRVRIQDNEIAVLNIKGNELLRVRSEFEIEIPLSDALEMRNMSPFYTVYKKRHICYYNNRRLEVDVFKKANSGLVIVEIEFNSEEEMDKFIPFDWMCEEVTGERKYYNVSLAETPYMYWEDQYV